MAASMEGIGSNAPFAPPASAGATPQTPAPTASLPPSAASSSMMEDEDALLARAMAASMEGIGSGSSGLFGAAAAAAATEPTAEEGANGRAPRARVDGPLHFEVSYNDTTHTVVLDNNDGQLLELKLVLEGKTGVACEAQDLISWPRETPTSDADELAQYVATHGPTALYLVSNGTDFGSTTAARSRLSSDDFVSYESDGGGSLGLLPAGTSPEDAFQFGLEFSMRFGSGGDLFHSESFHNTLIAGVNSGMPVILYLHSDLAVEGNIFCSEVLMSEMVVSWMKKNATVWGWDMTHPQ
eukprot:gene11536-25433_t